LPAACTDARGPRSCRRSSKRRSEFSFSSRSRTLEFPSPVDPLVSSSLSREQRERPCEEHGSMRALLEYHCLCTGNVRHGRARQRTTRPLVRSQGRPRSLRLDSYESAILARPCDRREDAVAEGASVSHRFGGAISADSRTIQPGRREALDLGGPSVSA
jgi:hypothetical protein